MNEKKDNLSNNILHVLLPNEEKQEFMLLLLLLFRHDNLCLFH